MDQASHPIQHVMFPPFITLAHLFNAPAGWGFEPRTLKQHQFQYVVEGVAEYTISGQKYTTRRGDLIYHAPNEIHEVKTVNGEPYVCISILFHFGDHAFELEPILGEKHYLGCFLNHSVEHKLSQIVAYFHHPDPTSPLYCQGLFLQLLHEIAQWQGEQAPHTSIQEKNKARLVLIRNYIAEHYREDIRHVDLERISGLSRNYIIVKFKHAFGLTPFEYLCRVRVERAKELAVHSQLTISEIAERVGYADVHTFGRMFKKNTGMSLSQFCASIVTTT